jgi:DNA-binding NtrC family response regulator
MKRQHILLTGEKRENALPLSLFLEGHDFQVTVEEKGSRVVEQIRQHQDPLEPFDLLVTGTQMSERLLLELLSEMESRKIGIPFIMISDNSNQAWVRRIRDQYAGIYVANPTEPYELVKVVEQIFKNNGQ